MYLCAVLRAVAHGQGEASLRAVVQADVSRERGFCTRPASMALTSLVASSFVPKIRSWPGQHPGLHLGRLKASLGEGVKARYENLARAPCGAPRISHKSHGVAAGADAALAAPSRSLRSPSRSSAALPSVGKRRRDADGRRKHRLRSRCVARRCGCSASAQ